MSLRSSALLLALVGCAASDEGAPVASDYRFDADDAASLEDAESLAWDAVESGDKVLAGVSSFTTMRVGVDSVGMAHVRLQQDVDGIPVFGGEAIIHLDAAGAYVGVTDDMVRDLDVDTAPLYTAEEALEIALDTYGQGNGLKHDATTSIVVVRVGDVDHLAYKVRIPDLDRDQIAIPVYFVDAHDGSIVQSFDDAKHVSLSDADKATYDMAGSTRYSRAALGDSSDSELDTSHNAIGSTLAYYAAAHGRDSFNGTGGKVLVYGHYSRNLVNAYWDGTRISVGDGDGVNSDYLGVLDVMAHEFSHGVTEYEANLTYSNESGALNEATSDIFASAVEAYVDGGVTADTWDIGEDCWLASSALRYMDAPSLDGSSRDHYSARYSGTSDNGGVHWNSGIANHFFYLLAAGGQHHTASYRTGTVVTGLGIDVAADIWYLALSSYMTSSTNFAGAATATLSACSALGYDATTCQSVTGAWAEVGVTGSGGGGGGGGTTECSLTCTDGTLYTGTLAAGTSEIQPGGTYFYTATGATGTLCGPSGTDFDLYQYFSTRTSAFKKVASSTSSTSSETTSYASAGNHYFKVTAYSGSGAYQLCIK
ncbi:MAG: M4 family metallopeptidase [Pseudomonadota bacterium]|nr:M4 family metallopeptidase [Pseudomonadota bacterium]